MLTKFTHYIWRRAERQTAQAICLLIDNIYPFPGAQPPEAANDADIALWKLHMRNFDTGHYIKSTIRHNYLEQKANNE